MACFGGIISDERTKTTFNHPPVTYYHLEINSRVVQFNVTDLNDLRRLQQAVKSELQKRGKEETSSEVPVAEKGSHRALHEIQRLTERLLNCTDPNQIQQLRVLLLETAAASNNLNRPPLPPKMDFAVATWFFMKGLSRPVGRGRTPASNLEPGNEADLSRLDPEPSTFWSRPPAISSQDLYHGFGRNSMLLESEPICNYAGPKESYGRNPGFEIELHGMRLKLKFAEVSSEPFAARVFDALGYHADPTDYAPGVRVRYSRRILQEFNSRKPLRTRFTFLGFVPMFTMELQQDYDPFDYLVAAILNDGTRLSAWELKGRLFHHLEKPHPENDPANFRLEVESTIAYLQTVPANVQRKIGKSIGPWDFAQLDHASRRELRGAGLLAAWLGWFDSRSDNTRLRIVDNSQGELAHFFSDLGGVLGETSGVLYSRGERPNAFPWTFTRPALWQGSHGLAKPLRLAGYKPVAVTPAFAAMTIDDARWMARLIAALSPEQIEQALVASGYDSSQVRLYLAKLLSRRERMMQDLGLGKELPPDTTVPIDRHLCYDPVTDGTLQMRIAGNLIQAPVGTHRILNGKLISAVPRTAPASQAAAHPPIAFSF